MSNVPYCPPRTATERRVVAIWQAALGVANVGVHDDFFALGGHSVAAIQIANRMFEAFHLDETFEHFLSDVTTVAELARRIDETSAVVDTSEIEQNIEDHAR
jgi:phthiocerol/phenolphthiocerol synthesis type-I polyketide synthase E